MELYPVSPGFQDAKLKSIQPSLISRSLSGKTQTRLLGGHYWAIQATYSTLTRAQYMPIYAFLMAREAQYDPFQLILPDLATPQGLGGSFLVKGGSQTGSELIIDGCTPSTPSIMLAGDIFTLAGDTKVYMLTADVTSDALGQAVFQFKPDLIVSPADNAAVTTNNCKFTVVYAGPELEYSVSSPIIYNFEAMFIESI